MAEVLLMENSPLYCFWCVFISAVVIILLYLISFVWCQTAPVAVNIKHFSLTVVCLSKFLRSPEMLRSEGSYSTGGRHSSTDSNKASSGDVSPYDNNSPVLSERSPIATQEEVARSPEKLYKVPEQYTLVGHLQPKTKENSSASQAGKGSVHPARVPPPQWLMGVSEVIGKCHFCIISYKDLRSNSVNNLRRNDWPTCFFCVEPKESVLSPLHELSQPSGMHASKLGATIQENRTTYVLLFSLSVTVWQRLISSSAP